MRRGELRRQVAGVAIAAAAIAAGAGVAGAQSDAPLGCEYRIAPVQAGSVSFENPLELVIDGCAEPWRSFDVAIGGSGTVGRVTEVSDGFACEEEVAECEREQTATSGASALFTVQCPSGGTIETTLGVAGTSRRTGTAKSFPCAQSGLRVLSTKTTQSLATAMKRGVAARYSCSVACMAEADVIVATSKSAGLSVGSKRVGAKRGGPFTVRVKPDREQRRKWRKKKRVTIGVNVVLIAESGEELEDTKTVTLRR